MNALGSFSWLQWLLLLFLALAAVVVDAVTHRFVVVSICFISLSFPICDCSYRSCDVNCQTVGIVPTWTQRIAKHSWNIVHTACISTELITRPRIGWNRCRIGKRRFMPCNIIWKLNSSERTNIFIRFSNNLNAIFPIFYLLRNYVKLTLLPLLFVIPHNRYRYHIAVLYIFYSFRLPLTVPIICNGFFLLMYLAWIYFSFTPNLCFIAFFSFEINESS